MGDQRNDLFKPLREAWSTAMSTLVQSPSPTCPAQLASRRAGILLGCYRKGDAEEPEIYAAAVASVLTCYPQDVAQRVTDPRSGLPGRSQWLPTVAEVKAACEAEMAPSRAEAAREVRRVRTARVVGEPIDPVERARVKAGFGGLRAGLWPEQLDARTAATIDERLASVSYHEARLAELKARYAAMPLKTQP